jgi:hypothetical protein
VIGKFDVASCAVVSPAASRHLRACRIPIGISAVLRVRVVIVVAIELASIDIVIDIVIVIDIFGDIVSDIVTNIIMKIVIAGRRHARRTTLSGSRSRALPTTTAASTTSTTTSTLRARPLALATFIRHVKTFPFGNRSHGGAECRRAQAAYRGT